METQINHMESATRTRLRAERRGKLPGLLLGLGMCLLGSLGLLLRWLQQPNPDRLLSYIPDIFYFASLVLGLVMAGHCMYCMVTRNTIFGRAARSQAQGLPLAQVFTQIDGDLRNNCRRFDAIDIGEEWVVGEGVMRIDSICGMFAVSLSKKCSTLCLVDVDDNVQMTGVPLEAAKEACDYLHTLCPAAATGGTEEYWAFLEMESTARYRRRTHARPGKWTGKLAFWGLDGVPTSLFGKSDIEAAFADLQPEQTIGLTLLEPQYAQSCTLTGLFVEHTQDGKTLLMVTCEEEDRLSRRVCTVAANQALSALVGLFEHGDMPVFTGWKQEGWNQEETPELRLYVDSRMYTSHTWEDITAAADGLFAQDYASFSLIRTQEESGGLFALREDGGYRIVTATPQGQDYRWMQKITDREDQVRFWFHNYYTHGQYPYCADWDDVTKKMENDETFAGKL